MPSTTRGGAIHSDAAVLAVPAGGPQRTCSSLREQPLTVCGAPFQRGQVHKVPSPQLSRVRITALGEKAQWRGFRHLQGAPKAWPSLRSPPPTPHRSRLGPPLSSLPPSRTGQGLCTHIWGKERPSLRALLGPSSCADGRVRKGFPALRAVTSRGLSC